MIEPLNRPTRLLRFVAGLARWSLGCLLALWLLLLFLLVVPVFSFWLAPLDCAAYW